MPILLNKVERFNPLNKTKKWYVTLKTVSQVSESAAAKRRTVPFQLGMERSVRRILCNRRSKPNPVNWIHVQFAAASLHQYQAGCRYGRNVSDGVVEVCHEPDGGGT